MRIKRAEILTLSLPFRFTFRHALAARSESETIVLRIESESGLFGHGECVPREYVTGENPASVRQILADPNGIAAQLARTHDDFDELAADLDALQRRIPGHQHAAACALELALLDLAGREFGRPAGAVLGPIVNPVVRYSAIASADDPASVRALCAEASKEDFSSVKLKLGGSLEHDRDVLLAAKDAVAGRCALRGDANCAWTAEETLRRLDQLAPLGLAAIEQPVAASDREGLEFVTRRSPVPVIADESLVSIEDAQWLADHQGCHVFNLRLSKCGGLSIARRMMSIGAGAGIESMIGAQVGETAILSAAGRQFASRVTGLVHFEGSYGRFLLTEDIGVQDVTLGRGGEAPCLPGLGLGVDVDAARLYGLVVDRIVLDGWGRS